jgi:hypothetical protein
MSLAYKTLEAAFLATVPRTDPIPGFNGALRAAFMLGATCAVRLLETETADLADLRKELLGSDPR